ncbi:LLM class flavin-dependent oxidoreductase [Chitinophaga nivalis]|uniref:LLM class flavin-dependent oxidoreductase n=1 Tax=Chitinophaga nivalis TaxID=2991709 RepID=A0ABT3IHB5_9BACT|nr:LLM class flavin-dependent oxidoreductase [Chitinophaga nivalis]MCW3466967.1 LLM class flavin-dependent oxidoreductase [Chitinophaga nivalis]MCW3483342.1 LLM class flavin-dependent oxidoreductase [Chitinophaga nivalis]
MFKIGLLEFGLRSTTASPVDVLQDVLNYAIAADDLGYSRFWLTEHHNLSPAWNNPEMLLPILAGLCNNMKIGIAGILMEMHSPYRVALNFKLLSALFPGKIDLGFARGKVTEEKILLMLKKAASTPLSANAFNEHVAETLQFLRDEHVHQQPGVLIAPTNSELPECWLLGSSYNSLDIAVSNRINFSKSVFHDANAIYHEKEKLDTFRENYFRQHQAYPTVSIAFSGICHHHHETAIELYQTEFEAGKFPFHCVIGTPELFMETLYQWKKTLEVDEFIFQDLSRDVTLRDDSLHLLSEIFSLKGK